MRRDTGALESTTFDLLVVGAGIYGICAAWDAAQRGLKVALVDRGDFCGATSSNSLRIVHGGLRYLQQADFRRMRRSIRERRTLLQIAPHVVQPLACVMPTRRKLTRSRTALRVALLMNDLVSYDRNRGLDDAHHLPRGRILSKDECLRRIPGIEAEGVTGGALWYDGMMRNSERLALGYLHNAVAAGAVPLNYFAVDRLLEENGRVIGASGRDLVAGTDGHEIRARLVLNTAGPWLPGLLGPAWAAPLETCGLSSAMNLVVRRPLATDAALAVGEGAARLLFLVPWNGVTLIGTTHLPYEGSPDTFAVTHRDIEWFVGEVNRAYPAAELKPDEVVHYHAGLLPSTGTDARGDALLLKNYQMVDHARAGGPEGLISVRSVKWTTSRAVAETSIDLVFERLGEKAATCRTATTPIQGGDRIDADAVAAGLTAEHGVPAAAGALLVRHHGSAYGAVMRHHDDAAGVLPGRMPLLEAEVLHAIRDEMAVHLADIVFRRTVLGSEGDPGDGALDRCAALAASELGWDEARTSDELKTVRARFSPTA